jgi:uncharacterized protein YndB with AHSA1/START domain
VIRIEFSIDVDRPPSEVFAYLTDAENLPQWQSSAVEAHWEGEKTRGARVKRYASSSADEWTLSWR